ncbi:hypothetical protein GOP47_0027718 [Adiantum capillus-veneris]|nr:hypothetical protein GOP47_0027718 [Adiantum capillus-veneris]
MYQRHGELRLHAPVSFLQCLRSARPFIAVQSANSSLLVLSFRSRALTVTVEAPNFAPASVFMLLYRVYRSQLSGVCSCFGSSAISFENTAATAISAAVWCGGFCAVGLVQASESSS